MAGVSGSALLGARRQAGGWAIALLGPAALAASLVPSTDATTSAVEAMAFLALTVLCALVGGLWPAVASAVVSTGLLTWYFTLPRRTLLIERTTDLVVLVLFLTVAVSVSLMVSHAARRAEQAVEARREADVLVRLNRLMLASDQGTEDLLELVRETFAAQAVSLLRLDAGGEECVAAVGEDPPLGADQADEVATVAHEQQPLHLALRGTALSGPDRRVFASFADHLSVALERRELAGRAARAQLLEDGNKVRNALLAAVSHDLRTPLARTKAAVSSLRSLDVEWTEEEERELLATIEDSTDRLHTIVANLLDLSRIQSDAVRPVLQEVGLEDVVARALDHGDGIGSIEVVAQADLPPVSTDVGLLERVVANLVDNAQRHSPGPGSVRVELTGDGQRAQLRVVDHGPGVPDADKEQMFGAFRRLGDTESRDGLGLGLAVARGLVEAMSGRLGAQDTPGGGLTMVVDLPLVPGRGAAPRPPVRGRAR